MAGRKTLIAYVTKGGATKEYAAAIAEVLRAKHKLEVDVINLMKNSPDISGYANIVAGSGVRGGKTYKEFDVFVQKDFGSRKLALFVVCGAAGDKRPEERRKAKERYWQATLSKNPSLEPRLVGFETFGGRMKLLWKVTFDYRDMKKAAEWAERVGKFLSR
jgi:menaquinone-dependent protoporphyrinogen IX oxidase